MERQPRGRAVVVSNRFFLKSNLELRDGAEFDETNICRLFTALHFSVQLYTNKSGSVCVIFCAHSLNFLKLL